VVDTAIFVYLLRSRPAFTAKGDEESVRLGAAAMAVAGAGAFLEALVSPRAGALVVAVVAIGAVAAALVAAWLLFRPAYHSQRADHAHQRTLVEDIVRRHGGDTLAYFALRGDKHYFLSGDTVVAYAVIGGVCLVSPDPIGPKDEHADVWAQFRRFAADHGWDVAVLGAGESWLPVYRANGMKAMYVGDEAIVDVNTFSLQGGKKKGLRQAVTRMERYGYRVEFRDPAHLDEGLRTQLQHVMTKSRRGDVERGFSMTLGRAFDPCDKGLLLAVAFKGDDAVAFCQFVPAPAVGGYSLDIMRRDDGEHPNGVIDFVIVRTIEHLSSLGCQGLGLNFATLRGVLAGERGGGLMRRAQRWLLLRLSNSLQIESLWRFTAKYEPTWLPRYAVFADAEQVLHTAIAIAKAESFSDIPLLGRFFVPRTGPREPLAA
jgi:lysylphosphatidylglycerol synthetase-like protein (DUF2156 family)